MSSPLLVDDDERYEENNNDSNTMVDDVEEAADQLEGQMSDDENGDHANNDSDDGEEEARDNEKEDETYEVQDNEEEEEEDVPSEDDETLAKKIQKEENSRSRRSRRTVVYKDFDEEEDEEEDVGSSSAPRVRSRYVKGSRGTRTTVKRKPRTTTRATSSRTTRSSRRAASGDSEDEFDFIPQKELRSRSTRVNYAEVEENADDDDDELVTPETNGTAVDEKDEEFSAVAQESDSDDSEDDDDDDEDEYVATPQRKRRITRAAPRTRKNAKGRGKQTRRKAVDSEEEDSEDSESEGNEEDDEENIPEYEQTFDEFQVEKILGIKFFEEENTQKYLIKFKDRSYIHVEWATKEEVEGYASGASKLKNFDKKYSLEDFEGEEEFFNPIYCEVDRILDIGRFNDKKMYWVKWKMLGYDECTWEFEDDIHDQTKIMEFQKRRKVPPKMARRIPARPPPSFFQKLETSPKFKDGNQLREYQLEGLNWLVFCWFNKRSSILADEMGLGKTVQTVSILEWLRTAQHNRGPFLVIAPLSTINHWKREFENWTEMNALVFHGNQESRNIATQYEFYYYDERGRVIPNLFKFNVLITTYETILAESSLLGKINWQYLVVDEGHRLKNRKSKLLETLRNFKTEHKLLLTGTPLQNDMQELWSLLNYIDSNTFDDSESFLEEFGDLQSTEDLANLHKLIGPYLLRRLKEDVEKSIPPKEEIVVEVVPTNIQKQYYRAILDRNREFLKRGVEKAQNVPKLINVLMEIRKVCNHPFLIDGAEENITKSITDEAELNECLIKVSSKLLLVDKLLKKLREGGHKVLIFSQMVRVLNILEDYLHYKQYPYVRLDGTIRGDLRQQAVDRFNNLQVDTFVFLVSTRAGGVGINLTSADTVIIFDSDWNPQNDLQAQARCHRIGQTKDVKIYRLLTKNTREKEMFDKASKKLGLDRAVLNGNRETDFEGFSSKDKNNVGLDKDELQTLLKFGAYAAFKDDTEDEKMLVEGDIDSILERNSTVVRYDTQTEDKENKQSEKGVLTFSKATFCFNENGEDVDINDENFWTKMLPEQKNAEGLMRKLGEKDSLKTEEEREQYFVDLNVLIEENQRQIKTFNYDGCDALANLLTQVMYSSKFDESRRTMAHSWLDLVEKPRLRNQKTSGNDSDDEIADDGDEYHDTAESSSGKKLQMLGGWYKAERQRFQKAFFEFGWGKWDQVRAAKLTTHTIFDIISFAENYVHIMRRKLSDEEKELRQFLRELLLSNAVPEDHGDHDHSDEETSTNGSEERTDGTPKEEEQTDDKHLIETLKISPDPSKKSQMEPGTKIVVILPEPKSGQLQDAHLEVVLQRRETNKERPNMVVRWIPLSEEDLTKGSTEVTAPGFPGRFVLRVASSNVVATSAAFEVADEVHACLSEKEYLDSMQRCAKGWAKKLQFLRHLHKVVGFEGEKTFQVPRLGAKAPAPWWNESCDAHLLLGIIKHGYGRFDTIKTDEELSISQTYHQMLGKATNRREKKSVMDTMPTVTSINKRALRLVEHMLKDVGDGDISKKSEVDVFESWAKRERQDLQRCLINRGLYPDEKTGEPQYAKIATQANLKKTNTQIKDAIDAMVRKAHEIKASIADDEDEKKDKNDQKDSLELTPLIAQKLISRINIMNELAQNVFPHIDEFSGKLKYLTVSGNGLTKWWKGSDDMALIRGVRKHGFDFRKIFESYPEDKKPPREGILMNRLSQIAKLGGKIAMLGSPSTGKNAAQWVFTPNKSHIKASPLASPRVKKKKSTDKKPRVVRAQTSIKKFTIRAAEDEDDPIEDSDDNGKAPRVAKKKRSSSGGSSSSEPAPRVRTKKAASTSSKLSSSKSSSKSVSKSAKITKPSKTSTSRSKSTTTKSSSKTSQPKSSPKEETKKITFSNRRRVKRDRPVDDDVEPGQISLQDLPPVKKQRPSDQGASSTEEKKE